MSLLFQSLFSSRLYTTFTIFPKHKDITDKCRGRTVFPTVTQRLPFGFFVEAYFYYVVGEPNGRASVKWRMSAYFNRPYAIGGIEYTDYPATQIRLKVNVAPSEIYKGLQIKEGEVKCIVECVLRYHPNMKFADLFWRCCCLYSK